MTPTAAPDTGIIKGTLTYTQTHKLTSEARAVVLLVDGTAGPAEGTTIASTSIKNPGPQPVPFELAYPFSAVNKDDSYRLYAGIVDGDLAWVTPIGVVVDVPQPLIAGVELPLEYRPDLLKGAVTGSITGVGLDPAKDPDSYGTSLIIDVNTGATIGFQLISPTGAVPVPYSVPFDPSTINPSAAYVARASMWDGTTLWNTPVGVPVITNDNPKSNVLLTVTPAVTASPSPTPAPAAPEPAPGGVSTWALLLLLALVIVGIIAAYGYIRSRSTPEPEPPGPIAPPPPPGPDPTEPPPPPVGASEPDPGLAALAGGTAAVAGVEAAAAEPEGAPTDAGVAAATSPEATSDTTGAAATDDAPPDDGDEERPAS